MAQQIEQNNCSTIKQELDNIESNAEEKQIQLNDQQTQAIFNKSQNLSISVQQKCKFRRIVHQMSACSHRLDSM